MNPAVIGKNRTGTNARLFLSVKEISKQIMNNWTPPPL